MSKEESDDEKMLFPRYTTFELILMAIIGALFGVITLFNMVMTEFLRMAFGLWGGMIVGGIFQVPGIMAYALVRKKSAAFITQNLMGIVQILAGSPIGFIVLLFTISEGIGQELTFFIFRHRLARNWPVWGVAGAMSMLFANIPNYYLYGMGQMPLADFLLPMFLVAIPSSIVFSIILTAIAVKIVPERFLKHPSVEKNEEKEAQPK